MAGVVVSPASVPVVPGDSATCSVRVRNTAAVVESFSVTVLGEAAGWTTVAPPMLSLFPGAEGTVELHFAPPRKPSVTAGTLDFGVKVVPSEDPDGSVVEEATLEVLPFRELTARITPRTSEAKRHARHEVVVDNRGNAALEAELSASDPDEQLAFDLRPLSLTVPPGQSARATVKVAARKGFARGADKHRPFQVRVTTGPVDTPTLLDATLVQKPGLPGFVLPLVGAVVAVALLAAVLPSLRKDGGGAIVLTGGKEATTTTEAPDEEPAEDPAQAAAEAEAAAAAERAANGQDPGAPAPTGSAGDATETAAAGTVTEGAAVSGPTGGVAAVEADGGRATPAAPVTTTTVARTPASTTTTAAPTATTVPSKNGSVRGTWTYDFETGVEGGEGTDIWWQQKTSTTRSLTPRNGAQLANMGAVDYEKVDLARLKSLTYSTAEIVGDDTGNQMPVGTVIAIKTNTGRYAKMRVDKKEPYPANTLYFRYYTYP